MTTPTTSTEVARTAAPGMRVVVPATASYTSAGSVTPLAALGDLTLPATGTVVPRAAHAWERFYPEEANVFVKVDGQPPYAGYLPLVVHASDLILEA